MANPFGAASRTACKRPPETSVYGTDVTALTQQIPLLSESLSNPPTMDKSEAAIGRAGMDESEIVAWDPAGTISTELWFEGLEYLIASAFGFVNPTVYTGTFGTGSGGSPAPFIAGQSFYHLFELDEELAREPWGASERAVSSGADPAATYWTAADQKVREVTLAMDKLEPSQPDAFVSSMVNKMQINVAPNKVSVDFDLISQKKVQGAGHNKANWVLPYQDRALFANFSFGLGAIGGTSPTALPVTELTWTLENNLQSGVHVSGSGSAYQIEPIRQGPRKVTCSAKLGRMDSQYSTWLTAETELQSQLAFSGKVIPAGGVIPFSAAIVMERVKLLSAEFPVAGPGVITGDIAFEALIPASHQTWASSAVGGMDFKKNNEAFMILANSREFSWLRDRHGGTSLP